MGKWPGIPLVPCAQGEKAATWTPSPSAVLLQPKIDYTSRCEAFVLITTVPSLDTEDRMEGAGDNEEHGQGHEPSHLDAREEPA